MVISVQPVYNSYYTYFPEASELVSDFMRPCALRLMENHFGSSLFLFFFLKDLKKQLFLALRPAEDLVETVSPSDGDPDL